MPLLILVHRGQQNPGPTQGEEANGERHRTRTHHGVHIQQLLGYRTVNRSCSSPGLLTAVRWLSLLMALDALIGSP